MTWGERERVRELSKREVTELEAAGRLPDMRVRCLKPFYLEGGRLVKLGDIVKIEGGLAMDLCARGRAEVT